MAIWLLIALSIFLIRQDDLVKALRVIGEISARLPEMMPGQVVDVPQVKGIETIGAASLSVRVETKVAPGAHYDVKRTLNRMQIPYPKSIDVPFEPRPRVARDA